MNTRRTRFYKAIFLSTHPSGYFFALINGNSHGFERLIDIMLRWIDLSFKESTSREILSTFLANSSIFDSFSSIKALKLFCELINSLILDSKSVGVLE